MSVMIKCSGCSKKVASDTIENFDGISLDGILFKKQLCKNCVKDIVDQFRSHIKAKEALEDEALKEMADEASQEPDIDWVH